MPREQVADRVSSLVNELKAANKKIAELESAKLRDRLPELLDAAEQIGDIRLVASFLGTVAGADDVRSLALEARERLGSDAAVVAFIGDANGKPSVVVATNEAARALGANAGAMVKNASKLLGGGGGGKPDVAQGGGQNVSEHAAALHAIRELLAAQA